MKKFLIVALMALGLGAHGREAQEGLPGVLFGVEQECDGHAMRAFAIREGVVYVAYDGGLCRSYGYGSGKLIAEFPLGANLESNHCGNLNFKDSLLYVSSCDRSAPACYVERIAPEGSSLAQTIRFNLSGRSAGMALIDSERNLIVYARRKHNHLDLSVFRLPSVDEGDICFKDEDAFRNYSLEKSFPGLRGGFISGERLYLSFGAASDKGFAVFDIHDGRLLKTVHVPTGRKPLAVQHYEGKDLMSFAGTRDEAACLCDIAAFSETPLKVMSFNIRNGHSKDGDNDWNLRKGDLTSFLNSEGPDVVGLQEVQDFQRSFMESKCPDYGFVGAGRDDGIKGEQTTIMWKKSALTLESWGYFWLSETPEKASTGWDAKLPRTATWALLKCKSTGESFYAVNTHLDHIGVVARRKGLELIKRQLGSINTRNLPVFLTGDFNLEDTSETMEGFRAMMQDSRRVATATDSERSFNAWGKPTRVAIIDYIFFEGFRRCDQFETITTEYHGRKYLSDHYPIVADLIL